MKTWWVGTFLSFLKVHFIDSFIESLEPINNVVIDVKNEVEKKVA